MTDVDDPSDPAARRWLCQRSRRAALWCAWVAVAVGVLVTGMLTVLPPAEAVHPSGEGPGGTAATASTTSVSPAPVDADALGPTNTPGGPWRRIVTEEFNTPVATGDFPGPAYRQTWSTYPDGWKDTSGLGTYAPSRTLSVSDGTLNIHVGKDGDEYLGAAVVATPTYGQTYGRFAIRWRADRVPGYGMACLLWPDDNAWPSGGEIDFPEGYLYGGANAFVHRADGGGVTDYVHTGVDMDGWHTGVVEWTPSAVTFVLDGQVILRSTAGIPHSPMHWVLQLGTDGKGAPPADASGTLQVDWVHIDAYDG